MECVHTVHNPVCASQQLTSPLTLSPNATQPHRTRANLPSLPSPYITPPPKTTKQNTPGLQPDVVSWSVLIKAHALSGQYDDAVALLRRMVDDARVSPTPRTVNPLVDRCARAGESMEERESVVEGGRGEWVWLGGLGLGEEGGTRLCVVRGHVCVHQSIQGIDPLYKQTPPSLQPPIQPHKH